MLPSRSKTGAPSAVSSTPYFLSKNQTMSSRGLSDESIDFYATSKLLVKHYIFVIEPSKTFRCACIRTRDRMTMNAAHSGNFTNRYGSMRYITLSPTRMLSLFSFASDDTEIVFYNLRSTVIRGFTVVLFVKEAIKNSDNKVTTRNTFSSYSTGNILSHNYFYQKMQ